MLTVPVGTQVYVAGEEDRLVADLKEDGERIVIAAGGSGGRGNASFATSTNQFPLLAEAGETGVERSLRLEMKLIADVGLVGLPNAGKSSLLAAVSMARPKVAPYPFTTLEPVLGVVEHRGGEIVMVDIPGLIEGASKGVGLGHDFLRHVERSNVLVHVVDGSADDPMGDLESIAAEMREFGAGLAEKARVIALNKMDIPEAAERLDGLVDACEAEGLAAVGISAVGRTGLVELMDLVSARVGESDRASTGGQSLMERLGMQQGQDMEVRPAEGKDVPIIKPAPAGGGPSVELRGGAYVVKSRRAERMAGMVDTSNWAARQQFYAELRRLGIVRQLEALGVSTGDTVLIGATEWEWT